MEEKKLTLMQNIAYAHWSAKISFGFPWFAWFLVMVVALIYIGLAFWFFEEEIEIMFEFSGPHALGKRYFSFLLAGLAVYFVSWATIYIGYFMLYFFENDDVSRKHYLKYRYRKHFLS